MMEVAEEEARRRYPNSQDTINYYIAILL